jgi:hypothetical protein
MCCKDTIEFLERVGHFRALQINEAIERCDACERHWWEVQGTHIPFVKGKVWVPLGRMLDHRRREVHTTDLHVPVFEIPCHMPRSTPQVTHRAPSTDTLGKGIEQVSIKGFRESSSKNVSVYCWATWS